MERRLGVAVGRRAGSGALLQQSGGAWNLVSEKRLPRLPGETAAQLLARLLQDGPGPARLSIALSPAHLACADAWDAPKPSSTVSLERLAPTLCEARCAGESAEDLHFDLVESRGLVRSAAIPKVALDEILAVCARAGFIPALVTSIPAALDDVFGEADVTTGGERFQVGPNRRRAFPVDAADSSALLRWEGLHVPHVLAPAVAAAACDPDAVPNLLASTPAGRRSLLKRFRDPLLNLAAAAALLFAALGIGFHMDVRRERAELESARRAELQLWNGLLPGQEPRPGALLRAVHDRLADSGDAPSPGDFPSALAFWGEIARQMPDPESLGLTLESLDLAPDGGRISARVPAVPDDPLKHAAHLEGRLNRSKKLTTRGDYEVRDGQVQVRLRMDYKP